MSGLVARLGLTRSKSSAQPGDVRSMLTGQAWGICSRVGWSLVFVFVILTVVASRISVAVAEPQEAVLKSQEAEETLEPFQISVQKSRVYTFVDKTGFGHQHAVEGRIKSGTLHLGALEEAGELVFDMTSFDADTDVARKYLGLQGSTEYSTRQQVNENMKNTSILNVAQFPTATFEIKSATLMDKKTAKGLAMYELVGQFTLRGKTRPLKFQAEVETKNGMAHVRGRFNILQTQYGITPFRKALGTIGVADQLTIHGDLWVAVESPDGAEN